MAGNRNKTPITPHVFRSFPGYERASRCRKCKAPLLSVEDDYGWVEGNKIPVHLCRSCWLRILDQYPEPSLSCTRKEAPWIWKFCT